MIRQFLRPLVVAGCIVVVAATPVFAAAPVQSSVTFDLSTATCSQLPSGMVIHGTGTEQFFVTPDGNLHSVIMGTATENNGGFWRFNYSDNMRLISTSGAVEVTDHFSLVGSGSPIKLHSHFVADFTSSDLETASLLSIKQIHGDPFGCDPI